jgi:hypothetical protein
MLKKANQKRMLDNVVIQEGEFTTDYFQKMDWRDMLGEEDLAKIGDLGPTQANGEPQDLSTVHGTDLEQALAAAEDENDVLAMQQAKHEMEGVDVGDFSEAGAVAAAGVGPNGTADPSKADRSEKGGKSGESGMARIQFEASSSSVAFNDEEGEVIEMGHVDEYMLRFMEREYGHYVGFGGLPKPVKLDEVDNEEEEEEEEEQMEVDEEEEEEEEEEEDEYDIEDDDVNDSGEEAGREDSSEEEEGGGGTNSMAKGKGRKEEVDDHDDDNDNGDDARVEAMDEDD